ncbi:hypothetical protein ACHWQZ_G001859 [Mnemiopsis leidyi]
MSWHELMLQVIFSLLFVIRYTQQQNVPPSAMPYPQFFLQPQKQSVKREMTTTIDCGAYGGIGNLTYSFFKGDSPQYNMMSRLKSVAADPDTQISSYFIPRVSSDDAGYYQCVVSDEAGVIIYSNVIYLQVVDNYLTRVNTVTESRLLLSTARLHVLKCAMPDSNPPALPRWFKDNVPINQDDVNMFVSHGAGTIEGENIDIGDLVMFALNHVHSGMYTCAAYNYQLEEGSNQIDVVYYNITVGTSGDVGEFTSQEVIVSDLTVNVGEAGYLFCGGIGNPAPPSKFLTLSPALPGVLGQPSRLVTVPASLTTTPNDYYAVCQVGNSYYTAKLVVVEPLINSVDSVTFDDTDTAAIVYYTDRDSPPITLSCDTTLDGSGDRPAKQWFKNGLVWNMGPYHETDLDSGFDLIAKDVRAEDSGVYQCKAFSSVLAVYRTQVLCVVQKLSIETVSPTLNEYEGRSKKLVCTIRGSPAPKMTWSVQNRVLESTDNIKITHNSLVYPYTTTVEILNISLSHSGKYVCGAHNSIPPYNGDKRWEDNVSATIAFKVQAPASVTSPNSTVLSFAGKELTLVCRTYGEPKPSVPQWRHQNVLLSTVDGVREITTTEYSQGYVSTLKIYSVTLGNQGNYTCSSWNYVNVNETSSLKISVPVISPINVSAPNMVEIERNVEEKITCTATGHPPARGVVWYFNNQVVTENIASSVSEQTLTSVLTVFPLAPSDEGEYRCESNNNYRDNVYNDSATVAAIYVEPVAIAATSQQMTGVYGKSLTLTCTATGFPLPDEIIWESRGYLVQDSNIDILSSRNLTTNRLVSELVIKETAYSNERVYNCSASNFFKDKRRTDYDFVDVTVEYPVKVRTWSKYAYNNKGKAVDVTCEIEGKPPPPKINWFFSGYPGQDITQSQYYSFNIVQRNNVINATLRINELSPALIGDYNCSASNVVDGVRYRDSRVVNVEIVRRVIVGVLTGIKSVPKGTEANLTCSGEGVPPPSSQDIQWVFREEVLPSYSLKYLMQTSEERIYKINSVLRISDVQLEDEGSYTCRFSNVDKTNSSYMDEKTIQLIVQVPVEVSFNSTDPVQLYEGESTTLTCNIFGKPPPLKVTWIRSKTGEEIQTDSKFELTSTNSSEGERITSFLTVRAMNLDLEGTYECRSENRLSSGRLVQTPAYRKILRVQDVSVVPKSIAVPGIVKSLSRLVCTATGVPTPGPITWRYVSRQENRDIVESDQYTITQEKFFDDSRSLYTKIESTLTIKIVRWADKGSYECRSVNIVNGEKKTSSALTTLNVGYPVSINKDTAETLQTLLGNQVGTLSVPLYGYPLPNITWSKNSGTLSSDSFTNKYISVEEYSGVAQLTYSSVALSHGGNYTITAINTVHNITYTVTFNLTVQVFFQPSITLETSRELPVGSAGKIPCTVTSLPPASHVIWYYNGTDLEEVGSPNKYTVEELVVDVQEELAVSTRNLVVKNAASQDAGLYTCKAAVLITDRLHYATADIDVTVVSAVVVSSTVVNLEVTMDQEVNITCTANGWPQPRQIMWYHNDSESVVVSSSNRQILNEVLSYRQIRSVIWIRSMSRDLTGKYECRGSNIVLGSMKTDKAIISVFEERMEGVEKAISSKEMLIIGVLAAIILVVILGVLLLLVFRHRKKKREKEDYERLKRDTMAPRPNGADTTLKADQERAGLIQLDPAHPNKPYTEVEYVELDPRVYKSDYHGKKFQPMPRKKRNGNHDHGGNSDYAVIDTNMETSNDRLI